MSMGNIGVVVIGEDGWFVVFGFIGSVIGEISVEMVILKMVFGGSKVGGVVFILVWVLVVWVMMVV